MTERIKKIWTDVKQKLKATFGEIVGYVVTNYVTVAMGFACSLLCAFSTVQCIITAFDVPINAAVLTLGCIVLAAVYTAASCVRRYSLVYSALMVSTGAVTAVLGRVLVRSYRSLVYAVTAYVSDYMGIEAYDYAAEGGAPDATLLMLIAAAVITPLVTAVVMRKHSFWLAAATTVPVMALCMIFANPAPWCGALLIGVLVLLFMTSTSRIGSEHERARRIMQLAPLMAMLIIVLTVISPPQTYERPAILDEMESMGWDTLLSVGEFFGAQVPDDYISTGIWEPELEQKDMSQSGPQSKNGEVVAYVMASNDETDVYLRAVSLATYENNTWSALEEWRYDELTALGEPYSDMSESVLSGGWSTMDIVTTLPQSVMLTPYYSDCELVNGAPYYDTYVVFNEWLWYGKPYYDAYISNPQQFTGYTQYFRRKTSDLQPAGWQCWYDDAYRDFVYENYTYVPEDIKPALIKLAQEGGVISEGAPSDTYTIARRVARYVKNSAVYDLETPRTPEGEDFALWFLTQSKRGYCEHYATAGALMLRSLGIPARYVTGYYVGDLYANVETTVLDDQAHAWVEFYIDGVGWKYLECTGSAPSTPTTAVVGAALPSAITTTTTTATTTTTTTTTTTIATTAASSTSTVTGVPTTTEGSNPSKEERQSKEKEQKSHPERWLALLLVIPLAAVTLIMRRYLMLRLHESLCSTGHPNSRALIRWKRITGLSKAAQIALPSELEMLAEKARFSRHSLDEAELSKLERYERRMMLELKAQDSALQSLVNMYIKNLY